MILHLLIIVPFPKMTSRKIVFTYWKRGKAIIPNNFIDSISYFFGNMSKPMRSILSAILLVDMGQSIQSGPSKTCGYSDVFRG